MKGKKSNKTSREKILSGLRAGKNQHSWHANWPESLPQGDVFPPIENLFEAFHAELSALGGEVFREEGESALLDKLKSYASQRGWENLVVTDDRIKEKLIHYGFSVRAFEATDDEGFCAGVTGCEALIARTGSVMVSSAGGSGRRMNVYMPVHIVWAGQSQIVPSIEDGFFAIRNRYNEQPSQISLISGPSRTADIETTLVMGAHRPAQLIVLIDSLS